MPDKEQESGQRVAPPASQCAVCTRRLSVECSHVECPFRKPTTAEARVGYEPLGGGCFRRTPTCRE
jgi:hypothetical protein